MQNDQLAVWIMLAVIAILVGGPAYLISKQKARIRKEYAEMGIPEPRRRTSPIVWLFLLCMIGAFLYIWDSAGKAVNKHRVEALNRDAKAVCSIAEQWIEDYDIPPEACTTMTGYIPCEAERGSFAAMLQEKFYSNAQGYYALVFDAQGNLQYALWSNEPLTDDRISVPDFDAQVKLFTDPFADRNAAIGYWGNNVT